MPPSSCLTISVFDAHQVIAAAAETAGLSVIEVNDLMAENREKRDGSEQLCKFCEILSYRYPTSFRQFLKPFESLRLEFNDHFVSTAHNLADDRNVFFVNMRRAISSPVFNGSLGYIGLGHDPPDFFFALLQG